MTPGRPGLRRLAPSSRTDRTRCRRTRSPASAGRGAAAGCAVDRDRSLAAQGARLQRPLWASTSTKDPKYPDIYYVEALIAPYTVNTLPPDTFDAYKDHGKPEVRIREAIDRADADLAALEKSGIELAQMTRELEEEGVKKFTTSYDQLLAGIGAKTEALVGKG